MACLGKPIDESFMAIRAAIANLLLRILEPDERAVVEGDLAELNLPESRAIAELLALSGSEALKLGSRGV